MENGKMIIYQVLPRLFGNTKSLNVKNGSLAENGVGKLSAFSPKVLTEIKKMGITHVWYTGVIEHATQTDYKAYKIKKDHPAVVKGKAGSPYAIKDYYDIDPDLADDVTQRMSEFEALVKRTHDANMKVIIDFVPNHVSRQYQSDAKPKGVVDLGKKDDPNTTYASNNNFYYIPGQKFQPSFPLTDEKGKEYIEMPAKATGNDCFTAHPSETDWYETVKLNYGIDYLNGHQTHFDPIPDTWFKMRDILLFWASKKVDGVRCDMAEMVPVEFWEWVIISVKEQYPDFIFIAEVYNPDLYRTYINKGHFDYLYDKVGLYDTLRNVMNGHQSAQAITGCWQAVDDIQEKMLNFLENHDEQRIASDFFVGNPRKAIPAMVIAAAMNTNPVMIYAGQELGEKGMDEEGFSGRDGRTTIFDYWTVDTLYRWYNDGKINEKLLSDEEKSLRKFYTKLLKICNQSKAIRNGAFFDLMYVNPVCPQFNPETQYAFFRKSGNELLLIITNFEAEDKEIQVYLPDHAFDHLNIDPEKVIDAKDLLTGTKQSAEMRKNACYTATVGAQNALIINFSLKK